MNAFHPPPSSFGADMTKKDYELIARVLREARDERNGEHDAILNSLAYSFAHALNDTNPKFDRSRFIKAATNGK